jgi:hypothetical protein
MRCGFGWFYRASELVIDRKKREDGAVLEKTTEVQLAANSFLRIESDSRGIIILCRSGSCWITQEGDPRDYYLRDERSFTTHQEGLVVVQALADTDIIISPDRGKSHLRRISPLKEGWLQRLWY